MKYFFNLEKQQGKAKTMTKTYDNAGQIMTKSHEVLNIQADFYKCLYTKDCNISCKLNASQQNN